ncbi:hypothetical protein DSECCO2_456170 [anaerobic digester metagenome]
MDREEIHEPVYHEKPTGFPAAVVRLDDDSCVRPGIPFSGTLDRYIAYVQKPLLSLRRCGVELELPFFVQENLDIQIIRSDLPRG